MYTCVYILISIFICHLLPPHGIQASANAIAFSAAISACEKCGRWLQVLELLRRLHRARPWPWLFVTTGDFYGIINHSWLVVNGCHQFWCFPEILGCDYHPKWRTHIFQRGGPTTNQIGLYEGFHKYGIDNFLIGYWIWLLLWDYRPSINGVLLVHM